MREFFDETPSLPSLPSDFGRKNGEMNTSERMEYEREQLCQRCAAALPPPTMESLDAARKTMALLALQGARIMQAGARIPFSLSAASLAADVRQCDCLGPAELGFFYEQRLMAECRFLIPRDIMGEDQLAFYRTIATWNQNRGLFRCTVIGAVLTIKLTHLEKRSRGKKCW